jgi:hypothetical protein
MAKLWDLLNAEQKMALLEDIGIDLDDETPVSVEQRPNVVEVFEDCADWMRKLLRHILYQEWYWTQYRALTPGRQYRIMKTVLRECGPPPGLVNEGDWWAQWVDSLKQEAIARGEDVAISTNTDGPSGDPPPWLHIPGV